MSNISVKKNFIFSSILTVSEYLFPLITFPYVSRVLGVDGIGICNYVDSVIFYFILLSKLGIETVGIRSIASCNDDKQKLQQVFSSLLTLLLCSTTIAIFALFIVVYTVPSFADYTEYFYIGACKLFSTFLLIEWFYKGREDFKYITKRSLTVKAMYVLSIFIFVQSPEDTFTYYLITCGLTIVNSAINIIHSHKFVNFSFKDVQINVFLKPLVFFGIYQFLTSMYTTFNVFYLGFVTNTTQVGYYITANKIYTVLIAFFSAFTSVMFPRMSNLLSNNKKEEFISYIKKSQEALVLFAVPMIVFAICSAQSIIRFLSGDGYDGAITPFRIVIPLILVIGFEQILVVQILNPLKQDIIVMRNSAMAALLGFTLNVFIVPVLASVGSALVWLGTELFLMILSQFYVTKIVNVHFPVKELIYTFLIHLPVIPFAYYVAISISNSLINLLVVGVIVFGYSFALQYRLGNKILINTISSIKIKSQKDE